MATYNGPSGTLYRVRIGLALAATGALLAACGSSSKAASSGTTGTTPSTAASTAPSAAASSKDSGSSGKVSTDLGGGSFCDKARKAETDTASAATKLTDGPDAFKQLEENAQAELSKLVVEAPSQIKGPVTTLVNAEDQFFNALKAADFDVTKVSTTATSSFDSPQVTQAIQQIDTYLVTKCGINPSAIPS
jgi:hypothetical protein